MARRSSRRPATPGMGKSKSMAPMHRAAMRRLTAGRPIKGLKGSGGGMKGMKGC